MAVNAIPVATDLVLVMDNGIGVSGQQLSIARTYKDVKTDADNEKIYSVADSLLSLQEAAKIAVQRRDVVELTEN